MAGLLSQISGFLEDMLGGGTAEPTGDAEAIVYTRGAESLSISAVAGRSQFTISQPGGAARVQWSDADWIFAASLLVLGGQPTIPIKGDTITATRGGVDEVYEVSTPTGEPEFYYSDAPANTQFRVHTKRVG